MQNYQMIQNRILRAFRNRISKGFKKRILREFRNRILRGLRNRILRVIVTKHKEDSAENTARILRTLRGF